MAQHAAADVPEEPPAVLRDDELKALLATCDGTDFDDRRDTAILRLFLDSGIRRAEIAGLRVDRPRLRPQHRRRARQGPTSAGRAVRPQDRPGARPLPPRPRPPPHATDGWLWLGKQGRLDDYRHRASS